MAVAWHLSLIIDLPGQILESFGLVLCDRTVDLRVPFSAAVEHSVHMHTLALAESFHFVLNGKELILSREASPKLSFVACTVATQVDEDFTVLSVVCTFFHLVLEVTELFI